MLENDVEWKWEEILVASNTDSETEEFSHSSDDDLNTINSVENEIKGIFKEVRKLSFDDNFAKSDNDESIINENQPDDNNEIGEEESQFVINLGNFTFNIQ